MQYSDKVVDHYTNPRNTGVIKNPDGEGTVGNPVCGDIMKIFLDIEDEIIKAYDSEKESTDIDADDKWQQSTNGTDGLYYRDIEVTCIVLAENTFKGS